jgi:hypothetical protein
VDEVGEALRRGVAEADDAGDEPTLLVLSSHPLRRRDGIAAPASDHTMPRTSNAAVSRS